LRLINNISMSEKINPSNNVKLLHSAHKIMLDFALKNKRKEIIGVFFGTIDKFGDVLISEAYPFRVGHRSTVDFQDEDYVRVVPLVKECESRKLIWLGWFHSHPFKRGDHLYLSNKDIAHQYIQQSLNPFWTAIVLNPHQKEDPNTILGARGFRLVQNSETNEIIRKYKIIDLKLV
jgi:proteasome lid subunit RPN8/RPN11